MKRIYLSMILIYIIITNTMAQDTTLQGKALYEKSCSSCHGTNGTKHLLGAKDLKKSKMEAEAIVQIIKKGKRFMPSYQKKFSEKELVLLVDYVKKLRE
jgi:cytochrome c6